MKEVRPTCFVGVPRVWEKMHETMKAIGAKASPMKKSIGDWAKSVGLQYNYSVMNGWDSSGDHWLEFSKSVSGVNAIALLETPFYFLAKI